MTVGDSMSAADEVERSNARGSGKTFWLNGAGPDDAVRYHVRGETYPRMVIRPNLGSNLSLTTLVGPGSRPPTRSHGYVNVRDFGAVGDYIPGEGGTDDSAAIYAAYLTMISEGISDLYYPKTTGYYYQNLTVPYFDGMRVLGDGPARFLSWNSENNVPASRIWDPRTTGDTFQAIGTSDDRLRGIKMEGLVIDGPKSGDRNCFRLLHAGHVYLEEVYFQDSPCAMKIEGSWDSFVTRCRFDGCGEVGALAATELLSTTASGTTDSNNWRFHACTWETNDYAIHVGPQVSGRTVNRITFNGGCKIETAAVRDSPQVLIEGGHGVHFFDGFSMMGTAGSGFTTPQNCFVVDPGTCQDIMWSNWHFELQALAGTPTMRAGILFDGTGTATDCCGYDTITVAAGIASGTHPTVAIVEWAGTNNDARRGAIGLMYTGGATVNLESGAPTSTMTRG